MVGHILIQKDILLEKTMNFTIDLLIGLFSIFQEYSWTYIILKLTRQQQQKVAS